jgi:RNA polymerase sigma-70 factor (ECF subfamily)
MEKDLCNKNEFERIFNQYGQDVRRFLLFKSGNIDTADDILQEVFLKLWQNCDNVNYEKVKSYLFTIANNMFLNMIKHNKVVLNYEKAYTGSQTNRQSPEYLMIEDEFYQKIQNNIASLPEKQRVVFLMNRMESKKYKEIAEELQISVKAVEKRMHLALKALRVQIGNI